jgi:hypothetical protein
MVCRFHRCTAPPHRPISGNSEVVDGLVPVVGAVVVMGEFSRDFGGVLAVSRLLAHRDTAMQLESLACSGAIVEHFLVKGMVEPEAGGNGPVRPGGGALLTDKLLASRETRAARLDFILRTLERGSDGG